MFSTTLPSAHAAAGDITTVAGTSLDGKLATAIGLNGPGDVIPDATGNLYVAVNDHTVIKILTDGTISTVAGIGGGGAAGDGGPAINAQLNVPVDLAFDASGNLYITDFQNDRIRKVALDGTITTVAGGQGRGYAGDGFLATGAKLNLPKGVAVDGAGNIYIADTFNNRIRKVVTNGTIISVVGDGTGAFSGDGSSAINAQVNRPSDVAFDASGNYYIADTFNHRIRMVSQFGVITTVAGKVGSGFSGDGGPATNALLKNPEGVFIDGAGNLYIADSGNNRIRKVDTSGTITTVAGNGTAGFSGDGGQATNAQINKPNGVNLDASGNIYIADQDNFRIRKVASDGTITTVGGNGEPGYSGDGGSATAAQLVFPEDAALDGSGNLYIADNFNHRIRKVSPGGIITTIAGNGTPGFSGDGGPAASAQLFHPQGVAVDAAGNIYICDRLNNRVRKIALDGTIATIAGNGVGGFSGDGGPATDAQLQQPRDIVFGTSGNIYISDRFNHRIRKIDSSGIITTVAGNGTAGFSGDGGPATDAQMNIPSGLALDGLGNLYIADFSNHVIRKVALDGTITTVVGTGSAGFDGDGGPATNARLWSPIDVAFDASGNLYVADWQNSRVRKIDSAGIITTVAGDGTFGFSGDGGPATSAHLWKPTGLAFDGPGNLFIADSENKRVRMVAPAISNPPSVSLTSPAAGSVFQAPVAFIVLTADASDSNGTIAKVEFFNGTTKIGMDTSAPYSVNWLNVQAGAYNLTAIATDNDGEVTVSSPVSITVVDPNATPPTVSLTSPIGGTVFQSPASITLTADASDSDGTITKVEFFNGLALLGTATSAPYSFNWTNVPVGTYDITAKAFDNDGASTVSSPINVSVNSAPSGAAADRRINVLTDRNSCINPWPDAGRTVQIYDVLGQEVWSGSSSTCWNGKVSGETVVPGIYIWTDTANKGRIVKKW